MEAFDIVFKTLTFKMTRKDYESLSRKHLTLGLVIVWIVGAGRYWDHPNPHLLQRLGFGSVIYVFVLAALLWAYYRPLRIRALSYQNILTFITLTSLPAALYAIPVERFLEIKNAQRINFWFLAIVASWRLLLLGHYLRVLAKQSMFRTVILALGPMAIVVTALTMLNLEKAVFEIMATGQTMPTSNDSAYVALVVLTFLSFWVGPILVLLYWASMWKKADPK